MYKGYMKSFSDSTVCGNWYIRECSSDPGSKYVIHVILNSPLECPSSCPPSPHCLYGLSGSSNSLCTPCSSYSHHIPEWLCSLSTSSRPPERNRHFSTCSTLQNCENTKCFCFAAAYVTTGPTVMSPASDSIKGLFALHAHGHLVVSDPARGSFTQLWYLKLLHRNIDMRHINNKNK